jgi:cysteine desulfurase
MSRVHLDSASGLPLHPAARSTYLDALDHGWADPLRLHHEGRTARLLLDNAREVVASVLGFRADEVGFVSSGTTACHLAVLGMLRGRARTGSRVVHSAVEHSAVLNVAGWAAPHGDVPADQHVRSVPVEPTGRVDLDAWSDAVAAPGVAVACLQAANHEVGTTQPLDAAADACRAAGVPLVVDAAALVGWSDVPPHGDVLAASAHKWGGSPGVGVLAVRRGTRWRSPWPGDEREQFGAGYVDVPSALASAAALQAVETTRHADAERMRRLTDDLRSGVVAAIPDVDVSGDPVHRLPHIVSFSCLYVDGEALVTELDRRGFAVSSGSACTSSSLRPSHVLAAMGVLTHGNVRVSVSPQTRADDLDRFVAATADIVARLRAERLR